MQPGGRRTTGATVKASPAGSRRGLSSSSGSGSKPSARKDAVPRAERKEDVVVDEEALPETEETPLPTPLSSGVVVPEGKVKLTMQLIRLRGLTAEERSADADTMAGTLLGKDILRLDSLGLTSIDNLEVFTLHELYLQDNALSRIEGLDEQRELQLLCLSSNCITQVENLKHLRRLQLLDLSNNQIEKLDTEELPRSLAILDLRGNPCCTARDYVFEVASALPKLEKLDGKRVVRDEDGSRPHLVADHHHHHGERSHHRSASSEAERGPARYHGGGGGARLSVEVSTAGSGQGKKRGGGDDDEEKAGSIRLQFLALDDFEEVSARFLADHCLPLTMLPGLVRRMEEEALARRAQGRGAGGGDEKGEEEEQEGSVAGRATLSEQIQAETRAEIDGLQQAMDEACVEAQARRSRKATRAAERQEVQRQRLAKELSAARESAASRMTSSSGGGGGGAFASGLRGKALAYIEDYSTPLPSVRSVPSSVRPAVTVSSSAEECKGGRVGDSDDDEEEEKAGGFEYGDDDDDMASDDDDDDGGGCGGGDGRGRGPVAYQSSSPPPPRRVSAALGQRGGLPAPE